MTEKEQIDRISYYEAILSEAENALKDGLRISDDSALYVRVLELDAYYGSAEWKEDFAADESGLLPENLKRGVLSEDGIYNVLERIEEDNAEEPITTAQVFKTLRERFMSLDGISGFADSDEKIEIRALTTDAILGTAERKDFPILTGKEIIQQAEFGPGKGQAFTSQPVNGRYTVRDLLDIPLDTLRNQSAFIAGMNAVMHRLGLIADTVHCTDDGPECCSKTAAGVLRRKYGDAKLTLIGYQPCLYANLSAAFPHMRVTDLSKEKIGIEKYGVTVEDGTVKRDEVCGWADVILCTGSTLTNGTFPYFYELALSGKEIMFYGTTISGAAELLGLKRLCFADSNGRPFRPSGRLHL